MHTKTLIKILSGEISDDSSKDLVIETAADNKILLHILRTLNMENQLRDEQENAFKCFIDRVSEIAKALNGLQYAFYKLLKPIAYVPADIDILIKESDLNKAVNRLSDIGYRIEVRELFTITMTRDKSIVDLYTHPSMGSVIYLDGSELLKHVKKISFHNILIPSLTEYAEALVTASHAIYKEMLYTLNDYITIKNWANERTYELAEQLKCKPALDLARKINEMLEREIIETPYKIPLKTWMKLWIKKIYSDPLTKSTMKNIIKELLSKRGLQQLKSKLTRKSY